MKITESDKQRFCGKFHIKNSIGGKSGCWQWRGALSGKYGTFWLDKNQIRAHRFSFLVHIGKIPKGKIVMHSCDNPLCVNPKHLSLGTQRENLLDCVSKGRHVTQTNPECLARGDRNGTRTMPETVRRGESHGMSKLNKEKVLQAREWSSQGVSNKQIAFRLEVSSGTIDQLISGLTWKHL